MGFMSKIKGSQAHAAHVKGDIAKAKTLYEAAFADGLDDPKTLLTYSILLLREQEYDKALDVLKRMEKVPGLPANYKTEMLINYSIICWKKGKIDRAIEVLQSLFAKGKTGTLYATLGYLYIEKALEQRAQGDEGAQEAQDAQEAPTDWAKEAKVMCEEAVEYDEEDPVFLDNLGQYYYRVEGNKKEALVYFTQAIEQKNAAIDTNYFLARYDIENGDTKAAGERLRVALAGRFSPLNYATPAMIRKVLGEIGEPEED